MFIVDVVVIVTFIIVVVVVTNQLLIKYAPAELLLKTSSS